MAGKLLVISGPSGAGKDTLLTMFREKHPDWASPLSTTTRKPRPGEINALHMNFVDRQTFEQWAKEDKFLEYFEVTGNLYGTLREPVEKLLGEDKNVVLRKEYQGALAIKSKMPSATIVFIVAEDMAKLEDRMRGRGQDSDEVIQKRMKLAQKEIAHQDQFDKVIINPEGHTEEGLAALEKAAGLDS